MLLNALQKLRHKSLHAKFQFFFLKIGFTTESNMGVAQGYTNFQKSLCITIIHIYPSLGSRSSNELSSILLNFWRNLQTLAQQGMQISSDSMGHPHLSLYSTIVSPLVSHKVLEDSFPRQESSDARYLILIAQYYNYNTPILTNT